METNLLKEFVLSNKVNNFNSCKKDDIVLTHPFYKDYFIIFVYGCNKHDRVYLFYKDEKLMECLTSDLNHLNVIEKEMRDHLNGE
jgi:hypothetical protein